MDVSSNVVLRRLSIALQLLTFFLSFSFLPFSEAGLEFNTKMGYDSFLVQNVSSFPNVSEISYINDLNEVMIDADPGPYLSRWIFSPAVSSQIINYNLFQKESAAQYVHSCIDNKHAVFRSFEYGSPGTMQSEDSETALLATLRSIKEGKEVHYLGGKCYSILHTETITDRRHS